MMQPAMEVLSASVQDYLKTIYAQTRGGQPTTTVALAAALDIRPASVTNMLQKLAEEPSELVAYRKHYGVSLTPEGEKAALQIIRRHRLIEQFLYQVLGYPLEKVHLEAEKLEHAVSPYFIERIARLLNDPAFDPHGDPIPDERLMLADARNLTLLAAMRSGEGGIVRHITDQGPSKLAYMQSIGICLGAAIRVTQVNPIDGTQQVVLSETNQTQVLGQSIGKHVQVEVTQ